MKRKLNKKGFTLVELLAVIVVLAVIMVIATQTIGNVLKESRADSYVSAVKAVGKAADTACTMSSKLDTISTYLQYEDIKITVTAGSNSVVIEAVDGGKFLPMEFGNLTNAFSSKYATTAGSSKVTYTASCSAVSAVDL